MNAPEDEGLRCICGHTQHHHNTVCFWVTRTGPEGAEFCECKGFRARSRSPEESRYHPAPPVDPRMQAYALGRAVGYLHRIAMALEQLAGVTRTETTGFCIHTPQVQDDGSLKCSDCGVSLLPDCQRGV